MMAREVERLVLSRVEEILSNNKNVSHVSLVKIKRQELSYNIVAKLESEDAERKFIIKVSYNISEVSREDIIDLTVLSKITSAIPIIVGLKEGYEKLRDDVVYRRIGVVALSITAFKKVVEGQPLRLVKDRGIIKAKVQGERLRRKREILGLSLGDVARVLHVTRKTVYEYERGTFEASERTARLLIELFGEDVLEEVPLEPKLEHHSLFLQSRRVDSRELEEKYSLDNVTEAYKLKRSHAHIAVSSGKERYLIVPRREDTEEAMRVAEVLDAQTLINGN